MSGAAIARPWLRGRAVLGVTAALLLAHDAGAIRTREVVLPPPTDGMEGQAEVRPPAGPTFRATNVNRCPGPNGSVLLQDTPCAPATAAAPPLAAASAEVVELATLAPRLVASVAPATVDSGSSPRWTRGLLDGAWKLGLLVLAGYLLVRGVASMRAWLRYRSHREGLR